MKKKLKEVAALTGWSEDMLKRFCRNGTIPATKSPSYPGSKRQLWSIEEETITLLQEWRQESVPVRTGRTYEKPKKEETQA